MLALFTLLPLIAAAAVAALVGDKGPMRGKVKYLAIFASLASLILLYFAQQGSTMIPWFSVGQSQFNITILVTPLNMLLLFIVFFMATVIMTYASGYMDTLSEQRRFYFQMLAFEAAMALFAMSGNFVTLFIAWEFLSAFSYLLIGFWYERGKANRAARKAVTMVLIGDIALLAAIAIFWNTTGSLEFAGIIAAVSGASAVTPEIYLGILLLLVAVFTKSAQFPFHEWLPDAMEGPTPVSAFLHSTTMVKAGVFIVILLLPLFTAANLLGIIMVVGIITAILATLNASRELHIKKVIAYSTMQELSLMLVAAAGGAVLAAIFFFLVQSFYKALLFFSSGMIMKSTNEEYLDRASGLKSYNLIYISTLFGILSIAGFIPFAGFFASVGLGGGFSANIILYAVITLIALGTSFFSFRWFYMVSKQPNDRRIRYKYSSQPKTMTYSLAFLAAMSLVSSIAYLYLGNLLGFGYMPRFFYLQGSQLLPQPSVADIIVVTAIAVIGAACAYIAYGSKYASKMADYSPKRLEKLIHNSSFVNAFYGYASSFVYELSEGAALFDLYISDISDWIGHEVMKAGSYFRKASVGQINPYALIFTIGIVALLFFVYVII